MSKMGLILVLILSAGVAFAVEHRDIEISFSVDPQKVMTVQERKQFGIDKFTPEQTQAFKTWLTHYALGLANQFQDKLNDQVNDIIKGTQR